MGEVTYPVGSLIHARGREWIVLPESDEQLLMARPLGGSEDEVTGFLLSLEGKDIREARFPLPDAEHLGDYRSSRLLRDALRLGFRASAGPFRSFGRIAVEPRPYQLVPLLMALRQDPVRLLIADDVGVGKTVEALLIARELLDQGDIRRMAVLCSPQLAEQWQGEMRTKFHIDAALLLSSTASQLERNCPPGKYLFDVYPHVVVSTDFIKSDRRRHEFLRGAPELVIVDEAHTCVHAGGTGGKGKHQRYDLLKGLAADATRNLLLLTATPHSGKEEAFRSLLTLVAADLQDLPDELGGEKNRRHRERLARYFVQRRRADLRKFLDEDTPFPEREIAETTYTLSTAYRKLFDQVLKLARETVKDDTGGAHRQRIRWWSALALLRSLGSSPRAASATLRNRAAVSETGTVEEADEVGTRTVLDPAEDEAADGLDVSPGGDYTTTEAPDESLKKRLRALAREADDIAPKDDRKLQKAIEIAKELTRDGFHPIFFCRFIPTAEYLAEHLREALGKKVTVEAVTGTLPPAEREARVNALGETAGPHILVATDCLSEGVNLQKHFNAVVHYDLSWNPTRHEQREGRADRYGQPSKVVRTVTHYGSDNPIDGIVLEVLLRKHQKIRSTLGISVPVPADTNQVMEALMEGLLLRGQDVRQLVLEPILQEQKGLFEAWDRAADKEKETRSLFTQSTIDAQTVAREVAAVRRELGSADDVARFVREAVTSYGGSVAASKGLVTVSLRGAKAGIREALGLEYQEFRARYALPIQDDEVYLSRTHPFLEALGGTTLELAMDPAEAERSIASRCGVIRTKDVEERTTLLLTRMRFHIVGPARDGETQILAEAVRVFAFEGSPGKPRWLDDATTERALNAEPHGNVGPDIAWKWVAEAISQWDAIRKHLEAETRTEGEKLLEQHVRVREAARQKARRSLVEVQVPPDVLGIYVLLPTVAERDEAKPSNEEAL